MPRWVTVFGRVNRLGAEPGTQAYSAWDCPGWSEYPATAGDVNRHIAWHTSPCTWWSRSVRWMPGWWLASGDQRRLTGSGNALETCSWRCAIQSHGLLYFNFTYFLLHIKNKCDAFMGAMHEQAPTAGINFMGERGEVFHGEVVLNIWDTRGPCWWPEAARVSGDRQTDMWTNRWTSLLRRGLKRQYKARHLSLLAFTDIR